MIARPARAPPLFTATAVLDGLTPLRLVP